MNDQFIKVFPNAVSTNFCQNVISHFERLLSEGRTISRQQHEGSSNIAKDDEQYFFENETNQLILDINSQVLREFNSSIKAHYQIYLNEIGILNKVAAHSISESIKIQKTKPGQGYHVWHCEHTNLISSRRLLFVILYLNNIEYGGETEFLYQSLRIPPVQGTLLFAPSSFTHTHRGNPPLKENKYIITTWIEFVE